MRMIGCAKLAELALDAVLEALDAEAHHVPGVRAALDGLRDRPGVCVLVEGRVAVELKHYVGVAQVAP